VNLKQKSLDKGEGVIYTTKLVYFYATQGNWKINKYIYLASSILRTREFNLVQMKSLGSQMTLVYSRWILLVMECFTDWIWY